MRKNLYGLKRLLVLPLAVVMLFTLIPVLPSGGMESVEAAATTLHKPRRSNGEVTYDCVWFGSYPQAEVVTASMLKKYETSYPSFASSRKDDDFIVDSKLYQTLKKAGGWDANGDITLSNGDRYHRINNRDITGDYGSYIDWTKDNTYHYFKYQPIRWRVLSTSKGEALLLAECGLDRQDYHTAEKPVTWETCTLRSWLNGYGSESNEQKTDYTANSFISRAFQATERKAIKTKKIKNKEYAEKYNDKQEEKYYILSQGKSTSDKIFLLSYENAKNTGYGFSSYVNRADNVKEISSSTYAWAMNAGRSSEGVPWALRSVFWGNTKKSDSFKMYVTFRGAIGFGDLYQSEGEDGNGSLVVPALFLDLSASDSWSYAGTVSVVESKNGLVKENGEYVYYKSDKEQKKYTGMVKNSNGKWYYVEKGKKKNMTGLVKHTDGSWWYVKKGEWQSKYTGLVKHSNGKWYYVENGKRKNTTGLVKHTDGKWQYVKKGELQPKYTGIVKQPGGRRYYVEKGRKSYKTGYVTVNGKRYKLVRGEVK